MIRGIKKIYLQDCIYFVSSGEMRGGNKGTKCCVSYMLKRKNGEKGNFVGHLGVGGGARGR